MNLTGSWSISVRSRCAARHPYRCNRSLPSRQEEITRIRWQDFEPAQDGEAARILVRDMKHPGDKRGNDVWCELPPEAVAIIEAMPKVDDRIFPVSVDAIS